MLGQASLHQRDREEHAKRLGLSLAEFDRLVASANAAYDMIRDLGPFYGKEEIKDPTFRITAQPVTLPTGSKETLTSFGNDLLSLAKALANLPEEYKKKLGSDLDYKIPPTWRIDAIIDEHNGLKVNEVEGQDGANALMMAEQLAYNLQTLENSTAAKLVPTLKLMAQNKNPLKIALIRVDVPNNPHSPNAERFINFLHYLSKGTLLVDHLNETTIRDGSYKPDWSTYAGVINETSLSPQELYALGIQQEQLIACGNYNALVNKGTFALVFEKALDSFWIEQFGEDCLSRLRNILIPSYFIETEEQLEQARKEGKVVKVSWAGTNTSLINRSRGVALPHDSVEHGSEDRWNYLKELLSQEITLIAQDFVIPKRIPAFLRKKGITLEPIEWHNRVCVKYVAEGNPNTETPLVTLTATEVTLGPDVIPAGRKCAFTAGRFD